MLNYAALLVGITFAIQSISAMDDLPVTQEQHQRIKNLYNGIANAVSSEVSHIPTAKLLSQTDALFLTIRCENHVIKEEKIQKIYDALNNQKEALYAEEIFKFISSEEMLALGSVDLRDGKKKIHDNLLLRTCANAIASEQKSVSSKESCIFYLKLGSLMIQVVKESFDENPYQETITTALKHLEKNL